MITTQVGSATNTRLLRKIGPLPIDIHSALGLVIAAKAEPTLVKPVTRFNNGRLSDTWINPGVLGKIVRKVKTPVFVYDEATLRNNLSRIIGATEKADLQGRIKPFIPFFANSNSHLLSAVKDFNCGLLLQSLEEFNLLEGSGFEFIVSPSI